MKRIVTITAVAFSLGLAACGSDGESAADIIRDRGIEQGLDEDKAQCVGDYLEDNLSDDELQAAADTTDANTLDADTLAVVNESLVACEIS